MHRSSIFDRHVKKQHLIWTHCVDKYLRRNTNNRSE